MTWRFLILLLVVASALVADDEKKEDFPLAAPLGLSETYPIDLYPDLRAEIDQKWNNQSPQRNVQSWESKKFPWGGVFVFLGLFILVLCLKLIPRKPIQPKGMVPLSQQRYQKAEAVLQQLQQQRDDVLAKSYFVELADAVRAAIEEHYHLQAEMMTTEEFFASLDFVKGLEAENQSLLQDFMQKADWVKFADHVPTLSECLEAKKTAAAIFQSLRTKRD